MPEILFEHIFEYKTPAGINPDEGTRQRQSAPLLVLSPPVPKLVVSRTLTQAAWNTTMIHDVVPEQIAELKAQPGGDIALSGGNLASTFMRHGVTDEFRVLVHPMVLGRGRPLFEDPDNGMSLKLEGTRSFGNGVVLLHYASDGG
ncbi:dihydrofolate reductase [Arthrobacter globiformis]|uniref:dihydrofolate reductase family protein n=1 Tax=Arthrobacter globiformis TaxID=1665 RepID=UPI00277FB205|nr:dihydrofolate reductase family protein [Arthrobacter globiformis]MDQ1057777.1 dihydrofolate reductase [Arthrobacter globiformis]